MVPKELYPEQTNDDFGRHGTHSRREVAVQLLVEVRSAAFICDARMVRQDSDNVKPVHKKRGSRTCGPLLDQHPAVSVWMILRDREAGCEWSGEGDDN